MFRIESLLSSRSFVRPQEVRNRLFYISNLNGQMNLYAMDYGGSVPEPLLPSNIALQNPHLMEGYSFYVFEDIEKIMVMVDDNGDENYQPMMIPMEGGFPEPSFGNFFKGKRVHLLDCDSRQAIVYLAVESRQEQMQEGYQGNLKTGELVRLGGSQWGSFPSGSNADHTKVILTDGYSVGDNVLYIWEKGIDGRRLIYGTPLEDRKPDQQVPLSAIGKCFFINHDRGLVFSSALFSDLYGLTYLDLESTAILKPIEISGLKHQGNGEMVNFNHLENNRYEVEFNIDGCSWVYEGDLDENALRLAVDAVVCGKTELSNGVLDSIQYNVENNRYVLSFSTATSPTQIYTVSGSRRDRITLHTREKVLGIARDLLSPGEDASYTSYDGTRISARLYLPSPSLGFKEPYPLVYYVHGGPQGQERPDFAWFSMPLIQYLTLRGLAVFVPNVRGSTGYGLNFTKQVDLDWGGKDRLDHVHAMTILSKDSRINTARAGVVGRSYGGYMSLTLAGRHPELWSAAVDMFGPYDLLTFLERIPSTWKPYYNLALGDPVKDRSFLVERSPKTHIAQLQCPLLVIQGKNDPRVVEQESHDLVDFLRSINKQVDYLMFENEGHDVLKYENRVKCYNAITDFFIKHLSNRS